MHHDAYTKTGTKNKKMGTILKEKVVIRGEEMKTISFYWHRQDKLNERFSHMYVYFVSYKTNWIFSYLY